ncbi:hypothetical protein [Streptomyces griseorubiginosus]|uniref:hypothetical protein n=1 Tax=Streptomyces griseorubiginosus TaxID=67304 RepID=UPI00076CE4E3|nr:hypothetical protein [Streptomyces griseorubiginosus]KUM69608.1 hypothetical protein AQI84_33345 [Streptomyces griseorubiginosus]
MEDYALWRRMPFPGLRRGDILFRAGENIALIHGDLALADEHVTQVILFVEEGLFRPSRADVMGLLEGVISRLERFGDGMATEEREAVDSHLQYAVLLQRIYGEFLRRGSP